MCIRDRLISEGCKHVVFPEANRLAIPVIRAMNFRIVDQTVRSTLEAKEASNLISLKNRTGLQVGPDVRFGDQRVVFRVDEEIVVIQVIGENFLMRKRKGAWVFAF